MPRGEVKHSLNLDSLQGHFQRQIIRALVYRGLVGFRESTRHHGNWNTWLPGGGTSSVPSEDIVPCHGPYLTLSVSFSQSNQELPHTLISIFYPIVWGPEMMD